jgi:hypothetical protein
MLFVPESESVHVSDSGMEGVAHALRVVRRTPA